MIHQTAIIHPSASIDPSVSIGPYCVIGEDVVIEKESRLMSHVVVGKKTIIGKRNKIYQFTSIGEEPIDRTFHDEFSQLIIGDDNIIRECATIHSGTAKENGTTLIGSNNLIMNNVHIGHDCIIKDYVTLVYNSGLAGHVHIDSNVTIGAGCGIHQFCHVGEYAFISHQAMITQDVLPYIMVAGQPTSPSGINIEGLKRGKFTADKIKIIRKAYKIIYRQGLLISEVIPVLKGLEIEDTSITPIIKVLEASKRGIIR